MSMKFTLCLNQRSSAGRAPSSNVCAFFSFLCIPEMEIPILSDIKLHLSSLSFSSILSCLSFSSILSCLSFSSILSRLSFSSLFGLPCISNFYSSNSLLSFSKVIPSWTIYSVHPSMIDCTISAVQTVKLSVHIVQLKHLS